MVSIPPTRFEYNAAKKINVYFIPAIDTRDKKGLYFYAIASALLHDEMMRCLSHGDIPHFAVVVEKGYGEPTSEIKAKIKEYYGFDHDRAATVASN